MVSSIDDRLNQIIRELIGNGITLEQAVEAFEGKYIVAAMSASRGNVTQASKALGVHRNTPNRFGPRAAACRRSASARHRTRSRVECSARWRCNRAIFSSRSSTFSGSAAVVCSASKKSGNAFPTTMPRAKKSSSPSRSSSATARSSPFAASVIHSSSSPRITLDSFACIPTATAPCAAPRDSRTSMSIGGRSKER